MNILSTAQLATQRDLVNHSTAPNTFFTDGAEAPGLDTKAIEDSTLFSMKLKGPHAEDALVASGAALAAGKPSLYCVETRKDLPWFLQEADQSFPGKVSIAEGQSAPSQPLNLDSTPAPSTSHSSEDTFIGCLMSGLSKEQYAEGRSHLQVIDQTLRERLGSPNNYCEGISVSSTASFDTPKDSLVHDIKAVQDAKSCVFYAYDGQSRPSGMWVEAGYAIESGKPCTFLVPEKDCLPPALRSDHLPQNVKVFEYGDHTKLLEQLHGAPEAWLRHL